MSQIIPIELVVFVTWCLLGSVLTDQGPECAPLCKNGLCPVKLDLLDNEECACRRILMNNAKKVRNFKLKNNDTIAGPRKFTPGGVAMLYLPESKICYGIGKGNISYTGRRIKITCSKSDEINFSSAILLSKQGWHAKIRTNKLLPEGGTNNRPPPSRTSHTSNCWSPETVKIRREGNSTLVVQWSPFYAHADILIRVKEESPKKESKNKKVPLFQVCRKRLLNYTFTGLQPGTYVAMVSAMGCINRTKSDSITISTISVETPRLVPKAHEPKRAKEGVPIVAIVIVVGVLAFISVCALGVTLYVGKSRQNYSLVNRVTNAQVDEFDIHHTETDDINTIAKHIRTLLREVDIEVTTNSNYQTDHDLEIFVSLKDAYAFSSTDESFFTRPLEVLMNHRFQTDLPLLIRVPVDCQHPHLRTLTGAEGLHSLVGVKEMFQALMPSFNFESQEYELFVKCARQIEITRKDGIRNIFLISGPANEHHINACVELTKMLKTLNKKVHYVFDEDNRTELRERGPLPWILDHLKSTDLVIVVASEYLYNLHSSYLQNNGTTESSEYLAECAPFVLKTLATRHNGPQIAYVTFGYDSEYCGRIREISRVESHMRYDLTEDASSVGQGESLGLEIFLSRLSSDSNLVQRACEHSTEFLASVTFMKELAVCNGNWAIETLVSEHSTVTADSSLLCGEDGVDHLETESCF